MEDEVIPAIAGIGHASILPPPPPLPRLSISARLPKRPPLPPSVHSLPSLPHPPPTPPPAPPPPPPTPPPSPPPPPPPLPPPLPPSRTTPMSDEQYTVILGDRRYAIHRKWAQPGSKLRLPVRPDGRRRGPRARGPARHRTAGPGVRARRPPDRQLGRGRAGRAALHQRRARRRDPGGRPRCPSGAALRSATVRLVQALGKRHWPSLDAPFNHPTAAAQAPDGEIYVADGYGNSSVHRFTADGRLIRTWGGHGTGPGAFTTPHAIAVEAAATCWWPTARTTASRCSTARATSSPNGATSIIRCRSGSTTATWCS